MSVLRSPFFRRLFLVTALLALLPVLATAIGASVLVRARAREEVAERLRSEAILLRPALAEAIRARDGARADAVAKAASRGTGIRVTAIAGDGRVLGDSDEDPRVMDDHATRPEVAKARATGYGWAVRFSDTVGKNMLYAAVRAREAEPDSGVIRAAMPADALAVRLAGITLAIAGLATPIGLAALISSALGIATLARAVRDVTRAAVTIAGGGEARPDEALGRDDELGDLARAVVAMGAELGARIEAIARERGELMTVVESLTEGLVAVDHDGRIVLWNDAATRLLGLERAPAAGERLVDAVAHGDLVALPREAMVADAPVSREIELYGAKASVARIIEAHATRVRGVPRERARSVIVLRDVTEAHRFERLRSEFVANVSHELRTPLTLVKGVAEALEEGVIADPEKGPRFLGILRRHVDGLERLVDDLLTLSALEAGADRPTLEPVRVAETIAAALEPFEPLLAARRIALVRRIAPGIPDVSARSEWVERAVRNLVDNAAKFTPDGGRIEVSALEEGDSVLVRVSDTGPGIPEKDLGRIFERFYRVEKTRSREAGGTGLGLAIVKHIMEQAGGLVSVESAPDRGSTFTLRFRKAT